MPRPYIISRSEMIRRFIAPVVSDERIVNAFQQVPRHLFVPKDLQPYAYDDVPLPIGKGQTISQPSLVAIMTELLHLSGTEKVLEVGSGSGYQAAILSLLANKVFSVERIPELASQAKKIISQLGYSNCSVIEADGTLGLPNKAPFDAIIVTASSPKIPQALTDQLAEGGRIVIPLYTKNGEERLVVGIKKHHKLTTVNKMPVAFVPLIGQYT